MTAHEFFEKAYTIKILIEKVESEELVEKVIDLHIELFGKRQPIFIYGIGFLGIHFDIVKNNVDGYLDRTFKLYRLRLEMISDFVFESGKEKFYIAGFPKLYKDENGIF